MTNPKTIAYYTSLFAVLVLPGSADWLFAVAACVAVLVSAGWWTAVALLFSTVAANRIFARLRKYLDLLFSAALVALGLRLAVSR